MKVFQITYFASRILYIISPVKTFTVLLAVLLALVLGSIPSKADVTGSFGLHLSYEPIPCPQVEGITGVPFIDQPCEKTLFRIDFETNLNINITLSGLTIGIHSHAGVTGFEDILLTFNTSIGMLDISDTFVFAQAYGIVPIVIDNDGDGKSNEDPPGDGNNDGCPGICDFDDDGDGLTDEGDIADDDEDGLVDEDGIEHGSIPTCYESAPGSGSCLTMFVKKRVNVSANLGGVTLSTLAIFEDINFPLPGALKPPGGIYNPQSQAFGFGSLITISGQTPSGITVTSQTGICVASGANQIKKHSFPFTVNPECVAGSVSGLQKGPFLFDFERLSVTGIPLASNITMNAVVECNPLGNLLCRFVNTFTITGGPAFNIIRVSTTFNGLPLGATGTSLSNITVVGTGGPFLVSASISPATLAIVNFVFVANLTVNPETNPAGLQIIVTGSPAITSLGARLTVQRAGLTLLLSTGLDVNAASGTFNFGNLTLGVRARAGVVNVVGNVVIDDAGSNPEEAFLLRGDLTLTVTF